ncbi:MAG: PKD domain-containing protein [Saprospiraceae bacterium]|nr:PKD domain-containing protein [Candidatus Opimibacter iunctus]
MRRIHHLWLLVVGIILLHGCKEDDYPVPPASTVPGFTYVIDHDAVAPATVTFTNTSIVPERAGQVSYYWSFGDGESSEVVNPVHTYLQPGAFVVNLVAVTDASLEIKQTSQTIVIKNPDASGTPIYFTDGSFVFRALVNEEAPIFEQLPVNGIQSSYGMTIDTVHDHLYISDYDGGQILRTNLDGEEQVVFRSGLIGPNGLAIDYQANQLYWDTDSGIQRGDLGNSDVNQLEDFVTGQANDPDGIAIDPGTGTLFWINYNGGVWRKKLDGSGEAEIIPLVEGGSILAAGDRIYYDQYVATGDIHLKSANLDGSGVAVLTTGISRVVYALGFEPGSQQIYWGDRNLGTIMRANPDGSGAEPFYVSAGSSPRGIVFGKKF